MSHRLACLDAASTIQHVLPSSEYVFLSSWNSIVTQNRCQDCTGQVCRELKFKLYTCYPVWPCVCHGVGASLPHLGIISGGAGRGAGGKQHASQHSRAHAYGEVKLLDVPHTCEEGVCELLDTSVGYGSVNPVQKHAGPGCVLVLVLAPCHLHQPAHIWQQIHAWPTCLTSCSLLDQLQQPMVGSCHACQVGCDGILTHMITYIARGVQEDCYRDTKKSCT